MKLNKLAPLLGVVLLAFISFACNKLKARDQLNKGVAAYRNASFQTAIDHFQNAVALDPTLLNARLYLATAYAQQYVPGGDSPDNIKVGEQAIESFQEVLKTDPNNTSALASIGLIYYQMKKFDLAKQYQERRLKIDPNDPEPYNWIGTLDWLICFPRDAALRRDLNLNVPKDPKNPESLPPLPAKEREKLAAENGPLVDEALKYLQKAIELKPNYSEAMAYLNLMYRQKADIEADPRAREADLKLADEWVQKALDVRKQAATATARR